MKALCQILGITAVASTVAFVPAASAADGVLIAQRITVGTAVTTSEVQIERTRMRTDIVTGDERQTIVFDGQLAVLRIISHANKSFTEITKAQMEQVGGMMKGAMAQMQAQMANMPPERRAQMEAMMGGRGMGLAAASEPTVYKRVGTDRVGKWTCTTYVGTRGGQKVSDICAVAPTALGLTAADFAITEQLAEFVRALLPQATDQIAVVGRGGAGEYSGIPIRSTVTAAGRTTTSELTAVSRQTFTDAVFAVPEGFKPMSGFGALGGK